MLIVLDFNFLIVSKGFEGCSVGCEDNVSLYVYGYIWTCILYFCHMYYFIASFSNQSDVHRLLIFYIQEDMNLAKALVMLVAE